MIYTIGVQCITLEKLREVVEFYQVKVAFDVRRNAAVLDVPCAYRAVYDALVASSEIEIEKGNVLIIGTTANPEKCRRGKILAMIKSPHHQKAHIKRFGHALIACEA